MDNNNKKSYGRLDKKAYERINSQILSMMDEGKVPWTDAERIFSDGFRSYASGEKYSLLNSMLLPKPGFYVTFNEVKKQGGHINRGSHGGKIYFAKPMSFLVDENGNRVKADAPAQTPAPSAQTKEDEEDTADAPKLRTITYTPLFSFDVFHIDDTTGVKPKPAPDNGCKDRRSISDIEDFLCTYLCNAGVGVRRARMTNHGYDADKDRIEINPLATYVKTVDYYKDFLFDVIRSTGAPSRLNRASTGKYGIDAESYSHIYEELVCEIGSVHLCSELRIDTMNVYRYSSAQIRKWTSSISEHGKLFAQACAAAEKAVRYVLETVNGSGAAAQAC